MLRIRQNRKVSKGGAGLWMDSPALNKIKGNNMSNEKEPTKDHTAYKQAIRLIEESELSMSEQGAMLYTLCIGLLDNHHLSSMIIAIKSE